jgi:hypothetical protein
MSEETTETTETTPNDGASEAVAETSETKTRAKRGANTELKFAVTVSANGTDYIMVPPQADHESMTEVRAALKEYAESNGNAAQEFYNSIVDLLPHENSEEMSLHFAVVRYLGRYVVKTETIRTTTLAEVK